MAAHSVQRTVRTLKTSGSGSYFYPGTWSTSITVLTAVCWYGLHEEQRLPVKDTEAAVRCEDR